MPPKDPLPSSKPTQAAAKPQPEHPPANKSKGDAAPRKSPPDLRKNPPESNGVVAASATNDASLSAEPVEARRPNRKPERGAPHEDPRTKSEHLSVSAPARKNGHQRQPSPKNDTAKGHTISTSTDGHEPKPAHTGSESVSSRTDSLPAATTASAEPPGPVPPTSSQKPGNNKRRKPAGDAKTAPDTAETAANPPVASPTKAGNTRASRNAKSSSATTAAAPAARPKALRFDQSTDHPAADVTSGHVESQPAGKQQQHAGNKSAAADQARRSQQPAPTEPKSRKKPGNQSRPNPATQWLNPGPNMEAPQILPRGSSEILPVLPPVRESVPPGLTPATSQPRSGLTSLGRAGAAIEKTRRDDSVGVIGRGSTDAPKTATKTPASAPSSWAPTDRTFLDDLWTPDATSQQMPSLFSFSNPFFNTPPLWNLDRSPPLLTPPPLVSDFPPPLVPDFPPPLVPDFPPPLVADFPPALPSVERSAVPSFFDDLPLSGDLLEPLEPLEPEPLMTSDDIVAVPSYEHPLPHGSDGTFSDTNERTPSQRVGYSLWGL
jgi:hypothetical protein